MQDRSFNDDGSLFYPDSREFFDGATAEDPGCIPDYQFRVLNGCTRASWS